MLQTRNGKRTGPAALMVRPSTPASCTPHCPCCFAPAAFVRLIVSCSACFRGLPIQPFTHPAARHPARHLCLQVAVAMAREGLVSPAESVLMVEPRHLDQLLHPMFEGVGLPAYTQAVLGKGLPASPGAAVGRIVFTAEEAEKWEKAGEKVGGLGGCGWSVQQLGW